ncbi:malonyl-CoA:anthocyanidin 5-O-glucoside-6'-O-malonyltransferase [Dorcoceras hygrometricum]|uniref:Malonyl-CoA:anthocyanidin 5-O-glucoside-6'-O-malonyltransferase n=1 Tax=Dorcoceras hygrometricum TaxID=472368 RepID=A0A2Z7CTT3_9LAMI|nr:malonyl-CoA:anthocyanidin 5-O-glucoside-6'-O-malonyltransferase [Dorcoceras hygrometricum]
MEIRNIGFRIILSVDQHLSIYLSNPTAVVLNYPDVATVGTLRLVFTSSTTKPAATTSRNIIPKQYQNDIVATNQNDVTMLHQLIPNPMRNNRQLVTLDNSKRRRNKVPVNKERRRFIISDWFFNPTAGHSAGTISHNATADSATTA